MILVDELRAVPAGRPPFHRALGCFLTTSNVGLDDLHAFASMLGLHRESFDPTKRPHYVITKAARARAIHLGATFVPAARQSAFRMGLCTFETMLGLAPRPPLAKARPLVLDAPAAAGRK